MYGRQGTFDGALAILREVAAQKGADYVELITVTEPHSENGASTQSSERAGWPTERLAHRKRKTFLDEKGAKHPLRISYDYRVFEEPEKSNCSLGGRSHAARAGVTLSLVVALAGAGFFRRRARKQGGAKRG